MRISDWSSDVCSSDLAAFRRLRRDMADRQPRAAAREAAVGDERADLAEPLRLQIAGRIEHLLHARPALRPLVADEDHVPRADLIAEDRSEERRVWKECVSTSRSRW